MLADLARAAAAQDPAAVRTLLVTVGPHLLRVVRKVLGASHPDVDDVVQESAFALLDALPRRRGESTVLYFACRIAVLTAMKVRRREAAQKRHSTHDDALVELLPSEERPPDAETFARIAATTLRELLGSLPQEQAETLALHYVLGYTISEVAALCDARVETVRSRLRLAKQALRDRISANDRLLAIMEAST
jgi:RNA polymerase sigma-70 factor (ECF subfamily)